MNWTGVDRMLANLPMPQGYRLERLGRSDIPELIGGLKDWYPDIIVGAAELLRPKPEYLTVKTRALFDVLFPE